MAQVSARTDRGVTPMPPKPPDEDLDFFGITHPGLVRKENQDHFLITTLHKTMRVRTTSLPNPELLEMPSQRLPAGRLVGGGGGGAAGGGAAKRRGVAASRSALEAIADYVTHTMQCFFAADSSDGGAFLQALREAAGRSHELVLERAKEAGERPD